MRTADIRSILIAFAIQTTVLCTVVIGAPVSKADKVKQYFEEDEGTQPAYYRIESRAFSEEDAKIKLNFLEKQGFHWTEKLTEGDKVSFRDTVKKKWLSYNPKQSRFIYYDNTPTGQNDNIVDIEQLRSNADVYASDLLGKDAKVFKYKNSEREYQVIRGTLPRLVSITFRYVRKLDGREILGTANHLRIKLTSDGTVRFLEYTNPNLVKRQEISSKIKRKSFEKYLDLYLKSADFTMFKNGTSLQIKSVEVSDVSSSYFTEKIGENEYLSPHTSFRSLIVTENGDIGNREFHMKDDPESVPGIQNEDIVHYIQQVK